MNKFDVRWHDGFEIVFHAQRVKFGSDYMWFVDENGEETWVPMRSVRKVRKINEAIAKISKAAKAA